MTKLSNVRQSSEAHAGDNDIFLLDYLLKILMQKAI